MLITICVVVVGDAMLEKEKNHLLNSFYCLKWKEKQRNKKEAIKAKINRKSHKRTSRGIKADQIFSMVYLIINFPSDYEHFGGFKMKPIISFRSKFGR